MAQMVVNYDDTITQEDTPSYEFTWTENGSALDVSGWTVYFSAEHEDPAVTDSISIATGNVTYSDSGTGTTDTFSVPLTSTDTDIEPGRYKLRVRYKTGTHIDTIVEGVLTINEKQRTAV